MQVLVILGIILAALVLLGQLRMGVQLKGSASGITVRAGVGPVMITVYPRKKSGAKTPRKQKSKSKPRKDSAKSKGISWADVKRFLPLIARTAGRLTRRIRIDALYLDVIAAAPDPALAALSFGGINAAIGMLWPLVEQNFNVKNRRIRTAVDFDRRQPEVTFDTAVTLTLWQAIFLAGGVATGILKEQSAQKAEASQATKQKEAI